MTPPVVTAFYAGLLGIVALFLAARVIAGRAKHAIRIGDGGREDMTLRIRAFGNFAEYVPLILVLAALAEGLGSPRWTAHAVGAALVAGRMLHAWGLRRTPQFNVWRFVGTNLTFAALLGATAGAFVMALGRSPF